MKINSNPLVAFSSIVLASISSLSIANSFETNNEPVITPLAKGSCTIAKINDTIDPRLNARFFVNDIGQLNFTVHRNTGNSVHFFNLDYIGMSSEGYYDFSSDEGTVSIDKQNLTFLIRKFDIEFSQCQVVKSHVCEYSNNSDNTIQFYIDGKAYEQPVPNIDLAQLQAVKESADFMTDGDCSRFGWKVKK